MSIQPFLESILVFAIRYELQECNSLIPICSLDIPLSSGNGISSISQVLFINFILDFLNGLKRSVRNRFLITIQCFIIIEPDAVEIGFILQHRILELDEASAFCSLRNRCYNKLLFIIKWCLFDSLLDLMNI